MEKTVKQVVVNYLQENGIPQNQFEVACGFGKGYMYHFPKNPSIDKMAKIIATYPDLAQPLSEFYPREETESAPRQPKESRPRIPLEVAAGLPGGLGECAKNSDCELMPVISQFPRYDMTIFIKGDSMYPNYQSGDELAIKQVFDYIEWGKVYVLDTREGAEIDIKLEPEAVEIINRYKKNKLLIGDFAPNRQLAMQKLNYYLGKIMPGVTSYYCRHSWATIADSLDVPEKIIALGLAHSWSQHVTKIYVRTDRKKLDEANRKVLDYVFYGK